MYQFMSAVLVRLETLTFALGNQGHQFVSAILGMLETWHLGWVITGDVITGHQCVLAELGMLQSLTLALSNQGTSSYQQYFVCWKPVCSICRYMAISSLTIYSGFYCEMFVLAKFIPIMKNRQIWLGWSLNDHFSKLCMIAAPCIQDAGHYKNRNFLSIAALLYLVLLHILRFFFYELLCQPIYSDDSY